MRYLLFVITIFYSTCSLAQTGDLRGFVYDNDNGEPIIFCTIILEGTNIGTSTDVNGFFSINNIAPGEYMILTTYIGYDTLRAPITIKSKQIITKKINLNESSIQLETVNISAERESMKSEVKVSVTKITPKEISLIPAIGGEPDLAQYLQVLPGVIFTGDQGGQLYIRGGSPIQNKVLLDGMIIYNPFHSIGLFSVFDTDIMRNADIYTGGFGAQHGGRISSIMDITTRDGNKNRFGGKISSSTFGSKLLLEGPLGKKGGNSSFIFSGKTSYLDQSSKYLYTHIDSAGLPYSFTDLYSKLSINGKNGSKLNLFGFNYTDDVNYRDVSDLGWTSSGIGSNFIIIPGGTSVLIQGNFAYSSYLIRLNEEGSDPRNSGINGFNLGLDFTYFQNENEINYGLEVLGFTTNYNFKNASGFLINQESTTTELSGFFRYKIKKEKLILEPGIRLYKYIKSTSFEPRLGAKYLITDNFRFKFAAGKYSQNLVSSTSDRDVVNLFYGFLSSEELDFPNSFQEKEIKNGIQKANHIIAGIEYDLTNKIDLNLESYIKHFEQLTNINKDKQSAEDYDFIIEEGLAKGIDFVFKYNDPKFYFWAVYSLGFVTRNDEEKKYNPHFDRRHNINLVSTYKFGYQKSWSFDARWNLGSGFPFTQTQGYYPLIGFNNGINTDYTNENGELGILYAEINEGRLPYYHRLDVALKKAYEINKNSTFQWNIGVTNAYNRNNIFYFNRVEYEEVYQLPFMPSVGASLTF